MSLQQYSDELEELRSNADSVRRVTTTVRETAENIEDALLVPRRAATRAGELERLVETAETVAISLSKVPVGLISVPAKFIARILDSVGDKLETVRKKADDVADDIARRGWNDNARDGRETTEEYEDEAQGVVDDIADHRESVLDADRSFRELAADEPLRSLTQPARNAADASVVPPTNAVAAINRAFGNTDDRLNAFSDKVDPVNAVARDILNIDRDLGALDGLLAALRKPLDIVDAALRPIRWALDAAGFIYNAVVAPVVDPILESLGINRLFDRIGDAIGKLLPDIGILDTFTERLAEARDAYFGDNSLYSQIEEPLSSFTNRVTNRFIEPAKESFGDGDSGGVRAGGPEDDTITGGFGADLLAGGAGDDFLEGLRGNDAFVGGRGDDELRGGRGQDTAVFSGSFGEYVFERQDLGPGDEATLFVTHVRPSNPSQYDGRDVLFRIENYRFANLSIADDDLDRVRRTPDDATQTHSLSGNNGRDFLIGGRGFDILRGRGGDDYLFGGESGLPNELYGGRGRDTLDFGGRSPGMEDVIDGGPGMDVAIFRGSSDGGEKYQVSIAFGSRGNLPFVPFATAILNIERLIASDFADLVWGDHRANVVDGNGGDDLLRGAGGNDLLKGGSGRDVLIGDAGNDVLDGGEDEDAFVVSRGNDTIVGGDGPGQDRLWYASAASLAPGEDGDFDGGPREMRNRIIDTGNNSDQGVDLEYGQAGPEIVLSRVDVDLRAGTAIKFIDGGGRETRLGRDRVEGIEAVQGTTGPDELRGTAQSEVLEGGRGADIIVGRGGGETFDRLLGESGNDILRTGPGRSLVDGGPGNDRLFVADPAITREAPSDKFDRSWFDGGANGGAGDEISFQNSAMAWEVRLDAASNQVLDAHFDLDFGRLAIAYDPDTITLANESHFALDELAHTTDAIDVTGIEVVSGSRFGDIIEGDRTSVGGRLLGRDGNDWLIAPGGNGMRLVGGGGDDILEGRGLEDLLLGGGGDDTLRSDSVFGSGRDRMFGGAGNDTIEATRARQTIDGGAGSDTVSFLQGGGFAVRFDLTDPRVAWSGPAEGDSIVNVENFLGTEATDYMAGDGLANMLSGLGNSGGTEMLIGRGGPDALYGGAGLDELRGGAGDDLLHGGAGGDVLRGGAGNDTASWDFVQQHAEARLRTDPALRASVDANLHRGTAIAAGEIDALSGIENLVGGDFGDRLTGDAGANALSGGAGNDRLAGGAGRDLLTGGTGRDVVAGQRGNDTLIGAPGRDDLRGGLGVDTVNYSAINRGVVVDLGDGTASKRLLVETPVWRDVGNVDAPRATRARTDSDSGESYRPADILAADELRARTDDDRQLDLPESRRIEEVDNGVTVVTQDFSIRLVELPVIQRDSLSGIENVSGGGWADRISGDAGENRLAGQRGRDDLAGGRGADHLLGGKQADVLRGGRGNDLLQGDLGGDRLAGGYGADTFLFRVVEDSRAGDPDVITDYKAGTDRIDLSQIDANAARNGNQRFRLVEDGSLDRAGDLRFEDGWLLGSVDRDAGAELRIRLRGVDDIAEADILL